MNIRVVREAGGIGDTVRLLPVLAALHLRHPGADVYLYAPPAYRPIYEHGDTPFIFMPTAHGPGRRPRNRPLDEGKWPYLAPPPGVEFDLDIDLYCPAFRYEIRSGLNVVKDRIQLFCEAAGVWPCDPLPRYHVTAREADRARAWLSGDGLEGKPLVGLQPFSTDPARDWPEAHWTALANGLQRAGCGVVVFDGCVGRSRRFRQVRCVAKRIPFLAALIAQCDLLITPDSGLYHLAAAVDTPAVGLFASQSGEIMSRHYPLHAHLSPPEDAPGPKGCPWPRPCFWRRPPACLRANLKKAHRTCRVLAALTPQTVLQAVLVHEAV